MTLAGGEYPAVKGLSELLLWDTDLNLTGKNEKINEKTQLKRNVNFRKLR
jgi:hypothetical protein